MINSSVQLKSITIQNFKNVIYGRVDLCNNKKKPIDTVLALYGQNGSGKTALIQALELFHDLAYGMPIRQEFCDFINVNAAYAQLDFEFQIVRNNTNIYSVFYSCKIRANETNNNENSIEKRIEIFDEIISYSYKDDNTSIKKTKLIDTSIPPVSKTLEAFQPKTKYRSLVGNDIKIRDDLRITKGIMTETSRSFIFSHNFIKIIQERLNEKNSNEEVKKAAFILQRLTFYAQQELFVVTTRDSALLGQNALPFSFKITEKKEEFTTIHAGKIRININTPSKIDINLQDIITMAFKKMNITLNAIIPNMSVDVHELGKSLSKTGQEQVTIEIVSLKNKKPIPLRYESEGIKKIVSILSLMIGLYNQRSMTVAIDELDSGIFEYLLGEFLKIISNKAKGQLIFTSHNLRPLETIDRSFIAFTTTDPKNRYFRQKNIRDTNNLRDFYFRNIVLGNNEPKLYDATDNAAISLALRQSGDIGEIK